MSLEERIERLERTNRRYRLMFTLLGVVAVCAVVMSAAAVGILGIRATPGGISVTQDGKVHDVIRAKRFVAVDDTGSPRAWLSGGSLTLQSSTTKYGQASVTLLDNAGNKLVEMEIRRDMGGGGEITVSSTTGRGKVKITTNDAHKRPVLDDSKTYPPGAFISVTGDFVKTGIWGGAVLSESSLSISKSPALNPEVELSVDENGGALAIRAAKGFKNIVQIDDDGLTTLVPIYVTTDDRSAGVTLFAVNPDGDGDKFGQVITYARGKEVAALTGQTTNGGTVVRGTIKVFADGKLAGVIGSAEGGGGSIVTYNEAGQELAGFGFTKYGSGYIFANDKNGKHLLTLGASENGGQLQVYNKTGEGVCTLSVDEYGNGVIGAWNRQGKGRTLTPGP